MQSLTAIEPIYDSIGNQGKKELTDQVLWDSDQIARKVKDLLAV